MNYLRKPAILALAILMALSTVAVASASTPDQTDDTKGIFGMFVTKDGNLLSVTTKDGEVTVEITEETEFKAPGAREGFTLDDLTTENKLAIQVVQLEGTSVVVRIMRLPRQPTHVHRIEVVVSAEGSSLTVSPSGGNIGSGRTRIWIHTDSIQQLQGRAGARQVTGVKAEIGISGGPMPTTGDFAVWSATPD